MHRNAELDPHPHPHPYPHPSESPPFLHDSHSPPALLASRYSSYSHALTHTSSRRARLTVPLLCVCLSLSLARSDECSECRGETGKLVRSRASLPVAPLPMASHVLPDASGARASRYSWVLVSRSLALEGSAIRQGCSRIEMGYVLYAASVECTHRLLSADQITSAVFSTLLRQSFVARLHHSRSFSHRFFVPINVTAVRLEVLSSSLRSLLPLTSFFNFIHWKCQKSINLTWGGLWEMRLYQSSVLYSIFILSLSIFVPNWIWTLYVAHDI